MNLEDKILEYLLEEMPKTERFEFEKELEANPEVKKALEEYKTVFGIIDSTDLEKPSLGLTHRFNEMITTESANTKVIPLWNPIYKYMGIAASVVILIATGILFGIQYNQSSILENQSSELVSLRTEVQKMLNDQSVPTRVNAMFVAQESKQNDPELVAMLVKTLKEDESSHVRLAAVQALSIYSSNIIAKDALIQHIENENDPFVKVAIIQSLSKMKESKAVHTFDNLIENEETPRFIKDEAHKAKIELNKI
jgi:HEAT repeat protein